MCYFVWYCIVFYYTIFYYNVWSDLYFSVVIKLFSIANCCNVIFALYLYILLLNIISKFRLFYSTILYLLYHIISYYIRLSYEICINYFVKLYPSNMQCIHFILLFHYIRYLILRIKHWYEYPYVCIVLMLDFKITSGTIQYNVVKYIM